jgi:nitrate reductase NapE component
MTDYASEPTSWYLWLTELSIIPQEYRYIISIISSLFLTLALTPIVPIVVLVIYDLMLWFWRLAVANWRARFAPRIEIAPAEPPTPPINGTAASWSVG